MKRKNQTKTFSSICTILVKATDGSRSCILHLLCARPAQLAPTVPKYLLQGYKHGCKTVACAEAGICACSTASNGQATGHIAGGPIPSPPVIAPPHVFPSGAPPYGNNASQMPSTEEGESAAGGNVVEETTLDGGGGATSQPAEAVAAA